MVLESRHLIGLFLLIVVISGIVFTLGYILGRSQYNVQVRAAAENKQGARADAGPALPKPGNSSAKAPTASVPGAPASSDWDFYRAAGSKPAAGQLAKSGKAVAIANRAAAATPPSERPAVAKTKPFLTPPLVPRGAIVLQVAALTREADALALAESLQKKKFPAFILTPGADHYYRVQVGPYADAQSANTAKRGLENQGFKAIVKR